jgi:hypothetical protein
MALATGGLVQHAATPNAVTTKIASAIPKPTHLGLAATRYVALKRKKMKN